MHCYFLYVLLLQEKQHSFSPSYEQLEPSCICEGYGMTRQSDLMIRLHIALRWKGWFNAATFTLIFWHGHGSWKARGGETSCNVCISESRRLFQKITFIFIWSWVRKRGYWGIRCPSHAWRSNPKSKKEGKGNDLPVHCQTSLPYSYLPHTCHPRDSPPDPEPDVAFLSLSRLNGIIRTFLDERVAGEWT